MKKRLFLLVTLFLFFVLTYPAFCLEGMITRLQPDGTVVINEGIEHGIQPQTIFYVTRMGEPIGKIKVVQVDDYSSVCVKEEVLAGKSFQVGDVISLTPYKTSPKKEKETSPSQKTTIQEDKMRKEYEKNVVENYKSMVEKKAKILRFRRGAGGTIKIHPFDVYNLLSTVVFTPGSSASFNIYHGLTTAYGIYASYKSTENPNRIRNVQMEITLWDRDYLDAYASYYAYKETITDPRKINVIKENIARQKGLDKFYVFHVKIINPGPGAFQLAPFPWHFYLKGSDGSRIKADHYDQILDKALNPNQVVSGYIYFKKDNPKLPKGEVTVILSDILGNNKEVTFR